MCRGGDKQRGVRGERGKDSSRVPRKEGEGPTLECHNPHRNYPHIVLRKGEVGGGKSLAELEYLGLFILEYFGLFKHDEVVTRS